MNQKNIYSDDIVAGITVGIIALPLALAFGMESGLGPFAGILGAIIGGVLGGLFGGCIVGVSGPTAPTASQITAFMGTFIIGTTQSPDLVSIFSIIFLSGLILIIISMLKISHFIHFIPYSVVAGFMCGIGVMIIFSQINSFVGLEPEKNFYKILKNLGYTISNINISALYVALPSLFVMLFWPKFKQKIKFFRNFPSPFLALMIGTSIAYFMDLKIPTIEEQINNTIQGTTSDIQIYLPDLTKFIEFFIPAITLAGLIIIDSLLTCIIADNMTGVRHLSDKETFAQGLTNMTAGLFGANPSATATMFTVSNIKFGAKTRLSSIVYGLTLLAILLGLKDFVSSIPIACIAAILLKVGIDIMDYRILPILKKLPVLDLIIFTIVLVITVYQGIMIAVAIGILVACCYSIKDLFSQFDYKIIEFSNSSFFKEEQDISKLEISVLKMKGPLFFASTESLRKVYKINKINEILIIDMSHLDKIDLSGIHTLEDLINSAKMNNIKVFIFNENTKIEKFLIRINFIKNLGDNYYIKSKDLIINTILKN